jgi:hypothetical protein
MLYTYTALHIYKNIYMNRYMEIIIKGAIELNLDNEYVEFLKTIPRAPVPPMYLHFLAEKNMNFVGFLFKNNYLRIIFGWSKLLYVFHYRGSKVHICKYVFMCIYQYVLMCIYLYI